MIRSTFPPFSSSVAPSLRRREACNRPSARLARLSFGLVLLALLLTGCYRTHDVPSDYAKDRMSGSINGLEVLTDLVRKKGCSVKHFSRLSPSLKTQDVLIWFPDDFGQPQQDALWFIEDWLSRSPSRMVFFVGRDYDAGVDYWTKVIRQTPAGEREIATRRLADARQRVDLARQNAAEKYTTPWFEYQRSGKSHRLASAQGAWTAGVDIAKADLQVHSRFLEPPKQVAENSLYEEKKVKEPTSIFGEEDDPVLNPPPSANPLPAAKPTGATVDNPFRVGRKLIDDGATPFAFEVLSNRLPGSKIFVIQNGRFLLNYGLVNPQHRLLASRMLQEFPSTAKVAILHSESEGPKVYWGQITAEKAKPDEVLKTSYVLLQLSLPVLLLLFVLLPVFGRARDLPRVEVSDFGKHIEAIGSLLQKGGDERYAWSRVFAYQQQFRRESGKRHAASNEPSTSGRQIVIQINAAAFGPGRGAELGTGQWLETAIASRNIGKVASKTSQPLCLEMHVVVQDPQFARTAIEAILREGRLYDQSTLFIR